MNKLLAFGNALFGRDSYLAADSLPTLPSSPFCKLVSTVLLFYFSFCTLVTLVSDVALRYGTEIVTKETDVSALGWRLYRHCERHIRCVRRGAFGATYWHAEVLLKISQIQSDAWGIF